jgi:hypothetical protein
MLAERAGVAESVQVLYGLSSTVNTRSELRGSLSLADQMLAIASRLGRAQSLATAHYAQRNTRYFLGDLLGARQHFSQALEHYREEDFGGNPVDPGVRSLI